MVTSLQRVKISLLVHIFLAWVATVRPSARWLGISLRPDQEICSRLSMSKEIKPSNVISANSPVRHSLTVKQIRKTYFRTFLFLTSHDRMWIQWTKRKGEVKDGHEGLDMRALGAGKNEPGDSEKGGGHNGREGKWNVAIPRTLHWD